ncbi:mediator of RNA polymerase II transcription subunit 29 [Cricetulus griseus]|uniref:Mediator of RNA polymerase II transcription subunit 29 n=1 Tax=Cricetulus griseus TaxID=10029 RepID=A0A061HWR7_CRIGR|nr:mediator of RNA polymerase II transcription subunit 29 [Cricetulus griseus]
MAAPQQQQQQQASAVSSAAGVSGPGSAGGPGSQPQPQPPQLVGPAPSALLQQQQQDFDPVQRYKMLIPQLKESLQVLRAGGERGRAGDRRGPEERAQAGKRREMCSLCE